MAFSVRWGPETVVQLGRPRTRDVMHVLICEDDATTRLLLKSMLKKAMPCEALEVPNGVEALALLRKKPFDLFLLDLMMPIMGGQDTLRWIRQTPSLQELQVIVLSGE